MIIIVAIDHINVLCNKFYGDGFKPLYLQTISVAAEGRITVAIDGPMATHFDNCCTNRCHSSMATRADVTHV